MATKKTMTIAVVNGSIAIQYTYNGVAKQFEYYPICSVKGIVSTPAEDIALRSVTTNQRKSDYHHDSVLEVGLYLEGPKNLLRFDIQDVTNQPTWLPTEAGLAIAVADINAWVGECGCCEDSQAALEDILEQVSGDVVAYNTSVETGAGSVPAGSRGGSMFNLGPGTVVWNGAIIPAGVGVPFEAFGKNNTMPAINFDATGSSMILEYTV